MRTIKKCLSLSFLFFLFACSNDSVHQETVANGAGETPAVLSDNYSASDILETKSLRQKSYRDIVKKLYLEAVRKNEKLKELNEGIEQIRKEQYEVLGPLNSYQQTNEEYWNTADAYVNSIQDSLQKMRMQTFFKDFKKSYADQIFTHEKMNTALQARATDLESQLLMLQLMVSADMMKNYQKNELPAIGPLEELVEDYDVLIQSTKDFYEKK